MSLILPFALLLISGLIPLLWLIPKDYLKYSFFIAPITGLIVIATMGLLNIGLLYLPLSPHVLSILLVIAFCISAALKRRELLEVLNGLKENYSFLLIPIFFISLLLISPDSLLGTFYSAGQDEIQYVNNSVHILYHQHTGDELDTLIPRVDHYLRDAQTINLAYSPSYRRGAEIFLAFVIFITGLNSFICFAIAGLTALFSFILALPAVCQVFLKLNKPMAITSQLALTLSHFWIILLLQGSLANLCSLGLILLATTATPNLYVIDGYKSKFLIGLLIAGPIIFYNEIAAPLILGPLLLLFLYSILNNKKIIQQLKYLGVIIMSIITFSHVGLIGLAWMTYGMLSKTYAESTSDLAPFTIKQLAEILSAFFGFFSYYSTSYLNAVFIQFISTNPVIILIIIFLLYIFSIYSLFQKKIASTIVLAILLIVLLLVTIHSALHGLHFMIVRTTQYAYIYILIGIIASFDSIRKKYFKYFLEAIFLLILVINTNTLYSSIEHLIKYDERTDPIIFRYSPYSNLWINFLEKINSNPNLPVLITGYNSTAKPMLISSLIEPNPNFLGSSIRSFWAMMPIDSPKPQSYLEPKIKTFHNILPTDTLFIKIMKFFFPANQQAREELLEQLPYSLDTAYGVQRMNHDSMMAVLMIDAPEPQEWEEKRFIARHRDRFVPIGDIVSKAQWSQISLNINGNEITKLTTLVNKNALIDVILPTTFQSDFDTIIIQLEKDINKEDIAIKSSFMGQVSFKVNKNSIQFKIINKDLSHFSFYFKNGEGNRIISIFTVTHF